MKIKALARLQATASEVLEVPPFRYVNDVQRYLDQLRHRLADLTSVVKVQQEQLAKLKVPTPVRASLAEINKKVAPGIRKLEKQYGLIQDLHELYRALDSVDSQFHLQFDERQGQIYEGVESSLKGLKADIEAQMRLVFDFLREVADKHVPSKFRTFMNSVSSAIEHQVPEARIKKTFLYASTCPKGSLVFTFYLYLVGESEEDHIYVSVQWVVGQLTYVQVNHEFATPDELYEAGPGTEADTANEAVKMALQLLNGEGLRTENARGPQRTQNYEGNPEAVASLASALSYL